MKFSAVVLLCLGLLPVASFADCHTGSDIVVNLTSPSGSGTYATPLHVQASATSSLTITGYVVYTNATGSYANAYQNNNRTTLNAWVILPLHVFGWSPRAERIRARLEFFRVLRRQPGTLDYGVRHSRSDCIVGRLVVE